MWLLTLFTRKGRLRFRRYRQIASTLVAHGFGEIIYQTGTGKLLRLLRRPFSNAKRRRKQGPAEPSSWVRIRMTLEELGPTFIKLGQILSNRPDLIPKELQDELEKLQERVAPVPTEEIVSVIEQELGDSVDTLFQAFDRKPLAAASIAQIHAARLSTGEAVAVKVQRPGLEKLVAVDVEILRELATLLERYVPESKRLSPKDLVDEFESGMMQELDFRREAAAMDRFGSQFEGEEGIKVPQVYRNRSSHRVLTMEQITGTPLAELLKGEGDRENKNRIAKLGAELTLKQIFVHGFFHADPHPGNVVILDDGRFCYLDFGLTGNLIQRDREVVSDILINIITRNEQKAARAVIRLAGSRDVERAQRIERDISELIDRFQSAETGDFSFTTLLAELIEVLVDEGLALPADLFLLIKSLITIEGIATVLDPDFDLSSHVKPFAEQLVRDRYSRERVKSRVINTAGDYAELLQSIPGDYYRLVDTVAKGKLRVAVEDNTLDRMSRTILQAVSSLVFAVVLAALIVGSALIVHSGVPPLWHDIPVIGIVGFLAAGVVGFGLLIKIVRTGGA